MLLLTAPGVFTLGMRALTFSAASARLASFLPVNTRSRRLIDEPHGYDNQRACANGSNHFLPLEKSECKAGYKLCARNANKACWMQNP
jgi:hypothetical protein